MRCKRHSLINILSLVYFSLIAGSIQAQVLIPVDIKASNPQEALRRKIFADRLEKRKCEVLAKDPAAATLDADQNLKNLVGEMLKSIKKGDEKTLRDLFNPRIKVKAGHVLSSLSGLKKITGDNFDVTNYRVMALNSPDGSTESIECEDTGVLLNPLYGYPLTIGVWLQATGDKEVARIFAQLVPDTKSWTIGAWHIQQWTHAGKDFEHWYNLASENAKLGKKASAYLQSELAAKLLDGGGFMTFPVKKTIDAFRENSYSKEKWISVVKDSFPKDDILYVAPLFAKNGAGILLRFRIKEELSANAIREHCQDRLKIARPAEWLSDAVGIRCAYNLPQEDAKKDGVLGSLFVSKDDLEAKIDQPK